MSDAPIKPTGAPLPLDDAALEKAATITPAVIADSIADARRIGGELNALLMARKLRVKRVR
jgi:hypothetical protein